MWSEAMRVCREYLPSQEAALRRELAQRTSEGANADDVLEEAQRWLEAGDMRQALDSLMRDQRPPRQALVQAAELLLHKAGPDLATQRGGEVGSRLFSAGEHALAAQVDFGLGLGNND